MMAHTLTIDDVFILTLTSIKSYDDPFRDITLSVVFSGPKSEVIEIPAQFKTDKWIIQFKPYFVGVWHYTTKCSDISNDCLHNIKGSFDVEKERERKIFKVEDYGARPNTISDSGDAIQKAIAAAAQYTEYTGLYAEVRFEENAVYRVGISEGNDEVFALNISDANNIKFNGQGAELVFTNPSANGIAVQNCENIVLCNLRIDYDPLPYAPGYIVDIDYENSTFDLKIDEGSLELDDPVFAKARGIGGLAKVFEGGSYKYGSGIVTSTVYHKIGDRLWRIDASSGSPYGYTDIIKTLNSGDRYSHNARTWGNAIGIMNTNNISCQNIIFYSSPGVAFFGFAIENIIFRDCHVRLKYDNRPTSTGADGIHLRSLRGFIVIDGCTFEGMGDDGINIHSIALVFSKVLSTKQVEVLKGTYDIRKGDRVVVIDTVNDMARAEVIASNVEDLGVSYRLTFDRDVYGMVIGSDGEAPDKLYNLDACGTSFVIRRCVFNSHRCRDILLSTQFGIIEDNIFNNEDGWGVVLYHETYWYNEGPVASDVVIRNNVFNGRSKATIAAIYFYLQLSNGEKFSKIRDFKNILIENNKFQNVGRAIDISSAQNVKILNNTVNNPDSMKRYGNSYSTISLSNCKGIVIYGLDIRDENKELESIIKISNDCESGVEGVTVESVAQIINSNTQYIADKRLANV